MNFSSPGPFSLVIRSLIRPETHIQIGAKPQLCLKLLWSRLGPKPVFEQLFKCQFSFDTINTLIQTYVIN